MSTTLDELDVPERQPNPLSVFARRMFQEIEDKFGPEPNPGVTPLGGLPPRAGPVSTLWGSVRETHHCDPARADYR